MNNEKVKEIKKALKFQRDGLMYLENNCAEIVYCKDILTLINELESENERLGDELDLQKMADKAYKYNMACENGKQIKQISELKEENQQLKDRIAELEKENVIRQNLINDFSEENERLYNDIHKKELPLKQFAERLKEHPIMKIYSLHNACERIPKAIDETLKEFINGKV